MKTGKLALFCASMLCVGTLFAQESKQVTNRYGIGLVKKDGGWRVYNEIFYRPPFNADSTAISGWNVPYAYKSGKIAPAQLRQFDMSSYMYKKYPSYDCRMDVYLPKKATEKPVPYIIFIHGGGWDKGSEKDMGLFCRWFSSNGIAAVSIGYTLMGQGDFAATVADMNDALVYVRSHAGEWGLDNSRFGFSGFSAGGHLSSYMAMTTPGTKVLISVAGPHNLLSAADQKKGAFDDGAMVAPKMEQYPVKGPKLMKYFGGSVESVRKASPFYLIPLAEMIPAVMLVHGTFDLAVPYQQSVDFRNELLAKGAKTAELLTVDYTQHVVFSLETVATCEENLIAILDFAKRHL